MKYKVGDLIVFSHDIIYVIKSIEKEYYFCTRMVFTNGVMHRISYNNRRRKDFFNSSYKKIEDISGYKFKGKLFKHLYLN